MIERRVQVPRERAARSELEHRLETSDANVRDVDVRDDRRAGHGIVVDARIAALVVRGDLGDDADRGNRCTRPASKKLSRSGSVP